MKTFIQSCILVSLILVSTRSRTEEAPKDHFKIAVQALPDGAYASLDGGCWASVPHHFFTFPGDHEVTVDMQGFGAAKVPVELSNRDMLVDVRLERKRGYYSGLSLFSLGTSAILPGLVLTLIGAVKHDTQKQLVAIGAPLLGAGAAFSLTGGLLLLFGRDKAPKVFVAPLVDLGRHKP